MHDQHIAIGTCGVHQLGAIAISLELFPWPEWRLLGLVEWLVLTVDNLYNYCWGDFATSHPTPPTYLLVMLA